MEQQTADNIDNRSTLEDEMDNQENILTQLIGDYDKVKTLSEGSDCQCKCVVRPLSRSACKRIEEGHAKAEDFYTVETVTAGPSCKKCACIAPPSALNPCEGDFRFKKLQEAGRDDVKLSTIMDLLEGAFYGMDLLKLHSITTKLLERVDNIENSFSGNLTKEKVSVKGEKKEGKGPRSNQRQEKKKHLSMLEPSLQKNAAAAFAHTERKYEEKFVGSQGSSKPVLKRSNSEGQEEKHKPAKTKAGPKGMTVKSMTFYKAITMEDSEGEEHTTAAHDVVSGDGSVDLITEDQLHKQEPPASVTRPATAATVTQTPSTNLNTQNEDPTAANMPNVTRQTEEETEGKGPRSNQRQEKKKHLSMLEPSLQKNAAAAFAHTERKYEEKFVGSQGSSKPVLKRSNSEGQEEKHKPAKTKAGPKGMTVKSMTFYKAITMEDSEGEEHRQFSNSYKLPYNWIGTGHVVYGGSFFYNRAFSRDIIRFDLRLRYVAAWTTLHDAVLEEEEAPWSWGGHSDFDFGVDESGLWLVYPALDEEGFHQEVIILSKLRPSDLQKEKNWRTGLRRNYYGNCFVICGVLYAVDSFQHTQANISYAFDTHTHTQMIPRLPFVNNYTYTTQIDYNPKERMLYAWDNGHQVLSSHRQKHIRLLI
ncbi:olfactomedin-like protein 2B [Sinocyclocheilus rhinocerous]|uniref:olfactomedin-like protein 2B n=1 Tax=Sinocyclocheilus rhinocerous TaxID=307959 RepID=UPI0007B9188A|nr:PREDICTED: olfactomedin-like protein 2B [Sinocyclocheilus rhinocerous]